MGNDDNEVAAAAAVDEARVRAYVTSSMYTVRRWLMAFYLVMAFMVILAFGVNLFAEVLQP